MNIVMYCPKSFKEEDTQSVDNFIKNYPMALLTWVTPELMQSYFPLVLKGDVLLGHCARANQMSEAIQSRAVVHASFMGPHAFIPAGYHEDPKAVPTWNYEWLQVRGVCMPLEGLEKEQALRHINDVMDVTWSMDKLDPERKAGMLKAIVAFRIDGLSWTYKRKHSQNKSHEVQQAVMRRLLLGTAQEQIVAERMQQFLAQKEANS